MVRGTVVKATVGAVVVAVTGAVAPALTATAAHAAGTQSQQAQQPQQPQQSARSVTVFLKAPNAGALAALARDHSVSHAQRLAEVKTLVPGDAQREQAVRALQAEGFTVTGQSTWDVSATAPAATVAATFGTRPKLAADATLAQRTAATGALPDMPSSLAAVASQAFPSTGGPAAFTHVKSAGAAKSARRQTSFVPGDAFDGYTDNNGLDFQAAYESPALTAAGGAPADGSYGSHRPTIATIQFTGWNSSDLSDYANSTGLPFSSSTLTQVPVAPLTSVPGADDTADDVGDDVEVDLDQETLLSTDPYAHQRLYDAENTDAGFGGAFSQVYDDVTDAASAYNGGDSHITTLSISWGECEAQNTPGSILDTFEPIIDSLVGAGVTVFGSSGDQGVYDCTETDSDGDPTGATVGVDYPASSPFVVGVGGTNLQSATDAFNNDSNWTETAWSCSLVSDCYTSADSTGGSGGGVSSTFDQEPGYQSGSALVSSAQDDRGGRLVPDIAADGDPATGFIIDTSDPTLNSGPYASKWQQLGGTSLASPESAALFTNMLSDHGVSTGIGDIHADLYDAPASAFRDITSGHNGTGSLAQAGVGYDTVTGLGAPYWGAIGEQIFDTATPKASATLSLPHNHSASSTREVKVAWTGTPAVVSEASSPARSAKTSGLAALTQADVTITKVGDMFPTYYDGSVPASASTTFTGTAGATYRVAVTVTDGEGDQSPVVTKTITVPIDDKSMSASKGGWSRHSSSGAIGGSYLQSKKSSASISAKATGDSYSLVFRVGPSSGKASVYVNGSHATTVNLHAAKAGFKTVHVWGGSSKSVAKRTVKVELSGSKSIGVDALYAYR